MPDMDWVACERAPGHAAHAGIDPDKPRREKGGRMAPHSAAQALQLQCDPQRKGMSMKLQRLLGFGVLSLALLTGSAFAQDKAAKQAEVVKKTQASMERFYKAKPELKAAVGKAPGYGIFTTYGVSFLVGGSGGTGLVHDNKTKKNTFMNVGGASAGLQLGATQTEMLIVFKTPAAMAKFVDKGWEVTGTATAAAGASGAQAGGGRGSTALEDAETYTLTKNGLDVGLAAGGSKFWKDKDLN
jgi:lipid-binding SYLF domain-containing protein